MATAPLSTAGPAARLRTWTMTREAIAVGFDVGDQFVGRLGGSDITRGSASARASR